ncbi:MAG TPA: hypothetical protein DCP92_04165 [Nitrospiraceae bacterium]|nr:hypothetical protein [Nitrospiraceae bacterium]
MNMDDSVKIYGLCLERLKHQIKNAKDRLAAETRTTPDHVLLESYYTGESEDIIDILELYDLEEKTFESLREKLNDLAYTVSVLVSETLTFGFTEEGHLGLYLSIPDRSLSPSAFAVNHSA